MKRNIQIRSVPNYLHQKLKVKAALSGKSMTDYLLDELRLVAERPTLAELRERILSRKTVLTKKTVSEVLRIERGD